MPYSGQNYMGSSGYVTGDTFPSIYSMAWDPITRTVRSPDPGIPGFDQFGRLKTSVSPAVAQNQVNPFAALASGNSRASMSKSGTASLDGYNPGGTPGQGYNPFFTVSNVKSPDIQAEIKKLIAQVGDVNAMNPTKAISDAMAAQDPNYAKYLQQETGAIGDWYSGAIESKLGDIRAQRKAAYDTATQRALDNLSRVIATSAMGMGGSGSVGNSSYLDKLALDTSAGLYAQQGLDDATQARADLMALLSGQQANAGARANLTTGDIQRRLIPSGVASDWLSRMISSVSPIASMQLANNFYGLGGDVPPTTIPNYSVPLPSMPTYPNSPRIPSYSQPTPVGYSPRPQLIGPAITGGPATGSLDALRQQILADAAAGNVNTLSDWQDQMRVAPRQVYQPDVAEPVFPWYGAE